MSSDLRGTWPQALFTFFLPLFLILVLRWIVVEPFVIPSGSMIPNLLIHDHILVKKFSYGVKVPFADNWLVRWQEPRRGEIVVFKNPSQTDIYFIKRLIGLPGDTVRFENSRLYINGEEWPTEFIKKSEQPDLSRLPDDEFDYLLENAPDFPHIIRYYNSSLSNSDAREFKVPAGQYFFMGDNRDQSSDSRIWGSVPENLIVGKAWLIWLSCDQMLASAPYLCDPSQLRLSRFFKSL